MSFGRTLIFLQGKWTISDQEQGEEKKKFKEQVIKLTVKKIIKDVRCIKLIKEKPASNKWNKDRHKDLLSH